MKKSLAVILSLIPLFTLAQNQREFYQLKEYALKKGSQLELVEGYLQKAFIPALHKAGVKDIGVFKPIEDQDDTLTSIYVLVPFNSFNQFLVLDEQLAKNEEYQKSGDLYINAMPDQPPYIRIESTILRAFEGMPQHKAPDFKSPKSERVYELRSYESATEKLHQNKVHMFNQGGEVQLFEDLGFNAVFYGSVVSGANMPNLMYMTTFENRASRDAHWKQFGESSVWNALKVMPEYETPNVSHIDILFLYPTPYSDY